jgi:hypothetical protein
LEILGAGVLALVGILVFVGVDEGCGVVDEGCGVVDEGCGVVDEGCGVATIGALGVLDAGFNSAYATPAAITKPIPISAI